MSSSPIFTATAISRGAEPTAPVASEQYRQRLAEAAGQGFISMRRRPASRRVIEGMLARGFRRPKLCYSGDGEIQVRAYYGHHRITRAFKLADGVIPDQLVLAGLRMTADRMDAKRSGGSKKNRRRHMAAPVVGHPIYVFHNNEQPKLDELVAALPPAGGMAGYLADMNGANDDDPVDQAA